VLSVWWYVAGTYGVRRRPWVVHTSHRWGLDGWGPEQCQRHDSAGVLFLPTCVSRVYVHVDGGLIIIGTEEVISSMSVSVLRACESCRTGTVCGQPSQAFIRIITLPS
jgi:hypothetical protein